MIWVFITTIFWSISEILYKRAVSISDIKSTFFQFFAELISIPVVIFILCNNFNYSIFHNPLIIWAFALNAVLFTVNTNIGKYLYANEKISTLTPYFTIDNFIIVFAWYLFFKDSSLISFIICIFAVIITTLFSVDFKNYSAPKFLWTVLIYQVVSALRFMMNVYVLKWITNLEFVALDQVFYISFSFLAILYLWEFREIRKLTKQIVLTRYSWYAIWFTCYFIDIYLLKEYWVIITTLFTFFGSSLSIALAYFFLKEVPLKKEIILWIIMIILVGLGYYFR